MAYDHANIGNEATAAVVRTDSALLALSCVEHDGDEEFCIMDGGNLNLNFGQVAPSAPIGDDGDGSGIQPGASYSFFDLIEITNNSYETIQVAISLSPSLANSPLGITVTSEPEGAGTDFFPGGQQHELEPGKSVRASFELTLGEDWNG